MIAKTKQSTKPYNNAAVDTIQDKSSFAPIVEFSKFLSGFSSLSGALEKELRAYYGKQTMDRLEKFITWLKTNERELLSQFKADVSFGKMQLSVRLLDKKIQPSGKNPSKNETMQILGYWLGTRYVASRFEANGERVFPPLIVNLYETADFVKKKAGRTASFDPYSCEFRLGVSRAEMARTEVGRIDALIIGLNTGIHEGAHALKYMTGRAEKVDWNVLRKSEIGDKQDMDSWKRQFEKANENCLSEVATFYCQTVFGLPIRNEMLANGSFDYGIYDALVLQKRISKDEIGENTTHPLSDAYGTFILGPWIKTFYEQKGKPFDIFAFANMEGKMGAGIVISGTPKQSAEWFCRNNGIQDPELRAKMVDFFTLLQSKIKSMGNDLENVPSSRKLLIFYEAATKVFGSPKVEKVPDGYANIIKPDSQSLIDGNSFFRTVS